LSLLKRPRQACCATPVQNQKSWKTAAFAQFQFLTLRDSSFHEKTEPTLRRVARLS
jgi:hypothetical protein